MSAILSETHPVSTRYTDSLTQYLRRKTISVPIGDVPLGSDHPIRVQSMTTVDTMDTAGSVAQAIRMIEAGCEYVRITAPSVKEAQNLENIRRELHRRGYTTPLIADIHFTPNAAELAARLVEKVRINPGNYADRKRFETIDYSNAAYEAELERIRQKFTPLVKICREYGTAMRVGTNHGSLSDRILSRYGDTPLGMVESALEFLRICEDLGYYQIAISMKASNPQVMVQAYRLLVQKLDEEGLKPYPLHLGVTEAGEAEDGRIKSAVGIGTLLEDGLGDTVRVSLTEEPELEAPVARALIDRYAHRAELAGFIPAVGDRIASNQPRGGPQRTATDRNEFSFPAFPSPIDPFRYFRRQTREVANFGDRNVPRVIADFSRVPDVRMEDLKSIGHFYLPLPDKWKLNDLGADYIYSGAHPIPFMVANGSREILDFDTWFQSTDRINKHPLLSVTDYAHHGPVHDQLNFLKVQLRDLADHGLLNRLKAETKVVLVADTDNEHAMPELRRLFFELILRGIQAPAVITRKFAAVTDDQFQLYAATDCGGLFIDGLGDGIFLSTERIGAEDSSGNNPEEKEKLLGQIRGYNRTAFGILQAARTRMSKTEYISCPSCGRTLFDLQETTATIRKRTDHLKGVKIGIMGCIVNGPGEMADADYGYVGVGKNKIALYRGQNVVKKFVPADRAVDELIELIKEDGVWNEPEPF